MFELPGDVVVGLLVLFGGFLGMLFVVPGIVLGLPGICFCGSCVWFLRFLGYGFWVFLGMVLAVPWHGLWASWGSVFGFLGMVCGLPGYYWLCFWGCVLPPPPNKTSPRHLISVSSSCYQEDLCSSTPESGPLISLGSSALHDPPQL